VTDAFERYFGLLPDQAVNPVGTALRESWASIVEVSIPGAYTGARPTSPKPFGPFSALFFPITRYDGNSMDHGPFNRTPRTLGPVAIQLKAQIVDDAGWLRFSIALVTQALFNLVPETRGLIKADLCAADVASWVQRLSAVAIPAYVIQFTASNAALVPGGGPGQVVPQYVKALTSPAWVTAKMAASTSGEWPDAAWEMFHHAIKILVAGGTVDDVTSVLSTLAGMGLPLAADFTATNWMSYRGFLPNPVLQWSDLCADGEPGLLAPVVPGEPSFTGVESIARAEVFVTYNDNPYFVGT
jgi:hypothetical protein